MSLVARHVLAVNEPNGFVPAVHGCSGINAGAKKKRMPEHATCRQATGDRSSHPKVADARFLAREDVRQSFTECVAPLGTGDSPDEIAVEELKTKTDADDADAFVLAGDDAVDHVEEALDAADAVAAADDIDAAAVDVSDAVDVVDDVYGDVAVGGKQAFVNELDSGDVFVLRDDADTGDGGPAVLAIAAADAADGAA